MEYQIVIPSHRRSELFLKRTYAFLKRCNGLINRPIIYVNDLKDMTDYSNLDLNLDPADQKQTEATIGSPVVLFFCYEGG